METLSLFWKNILKIYPAELHVELVLVSVVDAGILQFFSTIQQLALLFTRVVGDHTHTVESILTHEKVNEDPVNVAQILVYPSIIHHTTFHAPIHVPQNIILVHHIIVGFVTFNECIAPEFDTFPIEDLVPRIYGDVRLQLDPFPHPIPLLLFRVQASVSTAYPGSLILTDIQNEVVTPGVFTVLVTVDHDIDTTSCTDSR